MSEASPPTVAVLQTPPGAGGVAVVTLTGRDVRPILDRVFTPRASGSLTEMSPGRLRLGEIRQGDRRVDEALVTVDANRSGGGEVAEINIHGGPRVVQRVLQLLADAGAAVLDAQANPVDDALWPLAAPGLENPAVGAELLETLPEATTRFTLDVLTEQWRGGLSELVSRVLATIASAGGGGVPDAHASELRDAADRLAVIRRLLNPPEIVLAGPPNAGKSSLANALFARSACIVTDVAGTTRDWVRELADINGRGCWLTDTAGLWTPTDRLDRQAVDRAWERVDQADLVLAVFDASAPPPAEDSHWLRLLAEPNILLIANKSDLADPPAGSVGASAAAADLADCRAAILARLGLDDIRPDQPTAFTDRQAHLLYEAAETPGPASILRRLLQLPPRQGR